MTFKTGLQRPQSQFHQCFSGAVSSPLTRDVPLLGGATCCQDPPSSCRLPSALPPPPYLQLHARPATRGTLPAKKGAFTRTAVAISIAHRWPERHQTTGYRGREMNPCEAPAGEKSASDSRRERQNLDVRSRLDAAINATDTLVRVTLTQLDVEVEASVTAAAHSRSCKQVVRCR